MSEYLLIEYAVFGDNTTMDTIVQAASCENVDVVAPFLSASLDNCCKLNNEAGIISMNINYTEMESINYRHQMFPE